MLDLHGGSCSPWACALETLTDKRFLTRGDCIPQRLETLLIVTTGGQRVLLASGKEARDAAKDPTMHRTGPQQSMIQPKC